MRKLNVILALMILAMAQGAMAWGFNFGGYRYEVGNTQVVDYTSQPIATQNQIEPQIQTTAQVQVVSPPPSLNEPQFTQEVAWLNTQGEVQMALKELDYSRIGLINTDNGKEYTAFISQEGNIEKVLIGNYGSQTTLSGSLLGVTDAANRGDIEGVLANVNIPFSVKMKLLWMKLW